MGLTLDDPIDANELFIPIHDLESMLKYTNLKALIFTFKNVVIATFRSTVSGFKRR